jgi:hypothetical protein
VGIHAHRRDSGDSSRSRALTSLTVLPVPGARAPVPAPPSKPDKHEITALPLLSLFNKRAELCGRAPVGAKSLGPSID